MRDIVCGLGAILMISLGGFAQAPSVKPISSFDRQLIKQEQQFLRDAVNRDGTAVERAIAEDFQGIGANGDFYNKGELAETVESLPKEMRAYDFSVIKLNDTAVVVAYNLIVPGERLRYRHMSDTWAKIGGRWQIKFSQITPNLWSANDLD
jgi:hypothetical protein